MTDLLLALESPNRLDDKAGQVKLKARKQGYCVFEIMKLS